MRFVSTRDSTQQVSFADAVLSCMAEDGGLYVPAYEENLLPWILYMNKTTSFSSLAGALTSALIKEEFSPIISEAIATRAFPFGPEIRRLDDSLYLLELFHGPTGSHKDFGVSYLASCLEHILLMQDKRAVLLAVSSGQTGASIVQALRDKERITAVILFPKGKMRGFTEKDCVWNGGNIYPVEAEGGLEACRSIARELFKRPDLIRKYGVTLANTANIGRLLPQTFFYSYAFSRLKEQVHGDIYYALAAGNYGNLVAGLYAWKFSLPVNGFITDCTAALNVDLLGKCQVLDSVVPVRKRNPADPADPSNLERLEEVFLAMPAVLKGLVFPAMVTEEDRESACKELFMKYGERADLFTSGAYAALQKQRDRVQPDEGVAVLIARDHPAFHAEDIRRCCGEQVSLPADVAEANAPCHAGRRLENGFDSLCAILEELNAQH